MTEPRQFRLRIRYTKEGRLAMLSHLEITHALERIVRRSNLPFALTQGFSPHMKMAFGPALPVGVGGAEEVFDVVLTEYVAPERALAALQAQAPAELAPQTCAYVEQFAKAASVAFTESTYQVQLDSPVAALHVPESITVSRKGKEKVLTVADYLVRCPELSTDRTSFSFGLRTLEQGSLRPDVFAQSCIHDAHIVSLTRATLA